jgi:hypothetical protein
MINGAHLERVDGRVLAFYAHVGGVSVAWVRMVTTQPVQANKGIQIWDGRENLSLNWSARQAKCIMA